MVLARTYKAVALVFWPASKHLQLEVQYKDEVRGMQLDAR
jgi:hypothetical protein